MALAKKFPNVQVVVVAQKWLNIEHKLVNFCNLSAQTSMDDVVYLTQNAALIIANDSAPIHLAAAMEIPLIALFGPTDPKRFGPYSTNEKNNVALQAKDKKLSSISVDEVMENVSAFLA
jgi:ADP-heptose:LPS heptosyltransferase